MTYPKLTTAIATLIVSAFMLVACAPTVPYVAEWNVGNLPKYWASRPSSGTKSIAVHNPTKEYECITIRCMGNIFDGHSQYSFYVKAGGEEHGLISVPSEYMVGDACEVVSVDHEPQDVCEDRNRGYNINP